MMRDVRAVFNVLGLLLCATSAGAWTHGTGGSTTLPSQLIGFGAKTLAGFGGTHAGSTTGALTGVVSTTCGSNAFTIDSDGDLVPYGVYGSAGLLSAQSCTISLTNGIDTVTDPVVISPNVWTITPKPLAKIHQDTATANQLAVTYGSAMTLGDTIVCRDGIINNNDTATGPNNSGRWFIKSPPLQSNGYPWAGTYSPSSPSGRITITSEHAYSGTNARGNPIVGGGCQMAYIVPQLYSGDTEIPVDFVNLTFKADLTSPGAAYTQPLLQLLPGMRLMNSVGAVGPEVSNQASIKLANYSYTTGGLTPGDGVTSNGSNVTISGNEFYNGQYIQVNGAAGSFPHAIIVNNVIHDMWEKGISAEDRGAPLITDNLIYNIHSYGGNHSDSIIMNQRSYDAGGSVHQGATLLRNIILHGHGASTIDQLNDGLATGTLVTGSCSALSNATYLQQPVTGGLGQNGYLDVTVSGAPSACAFSAVRSPATFPTGYSAFAGGQTQTGGQGYQIGDVVTVALGGTGPVAPTGVAVAFTVTGLTANPDALGIFQSDGSDSSTGVVIQDNIIEAEDGDTIVDYNGSTAGAGYSTVNFNDAANDWQDASAAYGAQVGVIYPSGANVNANYNVTNTYNMAAATGSSTCLPGAPTDSPACQGAENTVRIPTTGYNLAAYQAVWKAYDVTAAYMTGCADVGHCYNRANAILSHEPASGGRGQVSGTLYATALCPRDNAGVLYWNTGVCDPTQTHTPAQ